VRIHFGQRVAKLIQEQERVTLETDGGLRASGGALIGADGIHSVVRREIAGPDAPRFSGEVVWRALVPRDRLSGIAGTPFNTVWTGGDRHVLQYPVRGGSLLNVGGFVRSDRWRGESWTAPGDRAAFASLFSQVSGSAFRARRAERSEQADQAKRQDRVQRLLEAVRWNARMFRAGNPLQRVGIDLGFWLMSKLRPTGPQEDFAWVYEYDALRA
jgi:2-polyprenyl-6-methoxyphenol hydroxylase-like FAD-dependent oxidoreductase